MRGWRVRVSTRQIDFRLFSLSLHGSEETFILIHEYVLQYILAQYVQFDLENAYIVYVNETWGGLKTKALVKNISVQT